MVIEIELKPENDMTVICDCVGILKERNVDVEHRLGRNHTLAASVTRNKKKSTKCRMVFRTKLEDDEDFCEILQICSNTITCTQPPGVPEICKKSLDSCAVVGGKELFIIGKNFLKDTKVTFVRFDESRQPKKLWEEVVQPDKEYLQQTHLICVVPPVPNADAVLEPLHVQIYVTSSNKKSEPHSFVYMPLKKSPCTSLPQSPSDAGPNIMFSNVVQDTNVTASTAQQLVHNVLSITWNEAQNESMMPPPMILPRKGSFSKNVPESSTEQPQITLKTEFIDQTSLSAVINGDSQDVTTSSSVLSSSYGDSTMRDVTGMPFVVNTSPPVLMGASQVQDLFDGFKLQPSNENGVVELCHIKNEQPEQSVSSPTAMLPPPTPVPELNSVQQQQVVENFLNLFAAPNTMVVTQQNPSEVHQHQHITQDIILNSPSAVTPSPNAIQQQQQQDASASLPSNMILSSAISTSGLMCEQNLMMNPLEGTSNSSLVSNAVSDATAETQAVVKEMIAAAAAQILSENPVETQSSINNFISSTLGTSMLPTTGITNEQQQMPSSQQLQAMLAQELNAATSGMIADVKKEVETNE